MQPSGIRIHNHVFSDAGGAQKKRKGLRAAIVSNTHRITWIYIWIISVLCKMNHQKHTKHNTHHIRIHVYWSLSKPNCTFLKFNKIRVSNTNSSPMSPMSWTLKPRFLASVPGTNVNPLGTLLQNFEAALYTVKRFYEHLNAYWTCMMYLPTRWAPGSSSSWVDNSYN